MESYREFKFKADAYYEVSVVESSAKQKGFKHYSIRIDQYLRATSRKRYNLTFAPKNFTAFIEKEGHRVVRHYTNKQAFDDAYEYALGLAAGLELAMGITMLSPETRVRVFRYPLFD